LKVNGKKDNDTYAFLLLSLLSLQNLLFFFKNPDKLSDQWLYHTHSNLIPVLTNILFASFLQMGQSMMLSICKEMRRLISSGSDKRLGQSSITRF